MSRKLSIAERLKNAQEAATERTDESAIAVLELPAVGADDSAGVEIVQPEPQPEPKANKLDPAMERVRRLYEERRATDEKLFRDAVLAEAESRPLDTTIDELCTTLQRLDKTPADFDSAVAAVREFYQRRDRMLAERQRVKVAHRELPNLVAKIDELKREIAATERTIADYRATSSSWPHIQRETREACYRHALSAELFTAWMETRPFDND